MVVDALEAGCLIFQDFQESGACAKDHWKEDIKLCWATNTSVMPMATLDVSSSSLKP